MARRAKRLPVGAVPEKALVATVRDDVINDGREARDTVGAALPAVRVCREVFQAGLAPFVVIATGAR